MVEHGVLQLPEGAEMKVYDISMCISEDMMVYKNKPENKPVIKLQRSLPAEGANETRIELNVHTGTHVDAPFHMIQQGETIEKLDPGKLITRCRVLDLTQVKGPIGETELQTLNIRKGEFILFKTANSYDTVFNPDYVFLDSGGASYLASIGVAGVGTDSLGIERGQAGHKTHNILMSQGVVIVEGLRLKDVEEGEYLLCVLPLKIAGADGAPARAVLIRD